MVPNESQRQLYGRRGEPISHDALDGGDGFGASPKPDRSSDLGRPLSDFPVPLCAFTRRRGHSPHDAQDLTQEFLLRVRKSFAGYSDLSVAGFRREQARRTTNGDKTAH